MQLEERLRRREKNEIRIDVLPAIDSCVAVAGVKWTADRLLHLVFFLNPTPSYSSKSWPTREMLPCADNDKARTKVLHMYRHAQ